MKVGLQKLRRPGEGRDDTVNEDAPAAIPDT